MKTAMDVSVVVAQMAAISELILLSDYRRAMVVPYLVAIVGVGMILLVGSAQLTF